MSRPGQEAAIKKASSACQLFELNTSAFCAQNRSVETVRWPGLLPLLSPTACGHKEKGVESCLQLELQF